MSREFGSLEALRARVEEIMGRSLDKSEWRACKPKTEPPYGDRDLIGCVKRIKNPVAIPLHRSGLNLEGLWYRGEYELDEDGYIALRGGGQLEQYVIGSDAQAIVSELLALMAGIKEEQLASGQASMKIKGRIMEFVRKRGLLGLAFVGVDAFVLGSHGEYLVAGGGSWACPLDLYFSPYLGMPTAASGLIFPHGFMTPSGLDEFSATDISRRFFEAYREHIDDFLQALLSFKEALVGYLFDPGDGALTFPTRAGELFSNVFATPSEFDSESDGTFGISLSFPSLMGAICLATVNMLRHGWKIKRCANERCESLFLSLPAGKSRRERLYCSMQCKNAQAYRTWYWANEGRQKDGLHRKEAD